MSSALSRSFPNDTGAKVLLAASHSMNGEPAKALKILEAIESPDDTVISMISSLKVADTVDTVKLESALGRFA